MSKTTVASSDDPRRRDPSEVDTRYADRVKTYRDFRRRPGYNRAVDVDKRIEGAFAGEAMALRALVYSLRDEGLSKQQIGAAFYGAFERLQQSGREADADAIADVLDFLTGFCSPSARILPNEPDVTR